MLARRRIAAAAWAILAAGVVAAGAATVLRAAPGARGLTDLTQAELGEGLRLRAHPRSVNPSFRMPLVPLLEADAFVRLGPAGCAAAFSAVYALTVLLVYALGFASGGAWGGLAAAGAWEALFAAQARAPGFAKQFVLTPLVVLAALALVRHARRRTATGAALSGAAAGASLLARGSLGPLLPFLAAAEAFGPGTARRRAARAAVLLASAAAVLLPWWTMNAVAHRRFIPLEDGAAARNIVAGARGLVIGPEGDPRDFADGPAARSGEALTTAARMIAARPGRFLRAVAARGRYALGLEPVLVALAAFGLLLRLRDPAALALASLGAYWLAAHCLMAVQPDYFYPLWALLAALAAAPLSLLGAPFKRAPETIARGAVLLGAGLAALAAARCGWDALSYAAAAARRAPFSDAAVEEAAARRPADPWAFLELARRDLRRGDAAGALAAARRASPRLDDAPRRTLLENWILAHDGAPGALLASVVPARVPFNDDLRALPLYQAATLMRLGRKPEARARLGAARALWLGENHTTGPDESGAAAAAAAAAEASFPEHAMRVLADAPDPDAAAVAALLGRADAWLVVARRRRESGDLEGARRALAAAAPEARGAEDLRALSWAWSEAGDLKASRGALERALKAEPGRAESWSDLGVLRFRLGDRAGAERAFRAALERDPAQPSACLSYGVLLEDAGRAGEAAALYERASARPIDDAGLKSALAEALGRARARR
jgi:tetratricopeptide (TPR) repeat protein